MKLTLLLGLMTLACVCARTTFKQAPVSAHITSLGDKDNKRKAMEHPAFANAGKRAGVEIWRIENFEPVAVPTSDIGKFYKGDSYIVLKTTADKRNNLSWDIHYWLGSQTSQDEAGAAAILTVGLDDKFGGAPVQHRETQGHESSQFLGYFQPAIRYMDGGHATGFSHVTTNAGAEKRLFQVKGKRNIRVRQVDPLISSMNKGDCFILDVNQNIFVYVGERAKNVEKLKAISVANQIRDQDHNGRGRVEIIDTYSSEPDVQKFFTALGSGSRDIVPEESAGGDDQTFERSEEQSVILSEISDSSGSLKITPLPKPYRQEQLKPQECYILDTVSGSIYVWVGKQSTEKEKSEAMSKAQQYLSSKNYPAWVHVSRIPQGTEPAAFKQYFTTWRDVGMAHSRIVRSPSDEEMYGSDDEVAAKRARTIGKTGSARTFMPDHGDGNIVVYRVYNQETMKVYESSKPGYQESKRNGEFYQGDSYIVDYEYQEAGDKKHVIYVWIGKGSNKDEIKAAALKASSFHEKFGDSTSIVQVPQGEEPKHFLKIFKGRFVTLLGGESTGANLRETNDRVRMFRISGVTPGEDMRAVQVKESFKNLQSDDVFLVLTSGKNYIWYGKDSTNAEREEAEKFLQQLHNGDRNIKSTFEVVQDGDETPDFLAYLDRNGDTETPFNWRSNLNKRVGFEPRLYDVDVAGKISFEEIHNFEQTDLQSDDVYVLDTGDEVMIWVGREASPTMRKAAITDFVIKSYLTQYSYASRVVIILKQGFETKSFTQMFDKWDYDLWKKQKSLNAELEKALHLNENKIYE